MKKVLITNKELAKEYLDEIKLIYKKGTYLARETVINKYFLTFFKEDSKSKLDLNYENICQFKKYVGNLKLSPSRKNLIFSVTKKIIIFAEEKEILEFEKALKLQKSLKPIRKNKECQNSFTFWTDEEFEDFIKTFEYQDTKWQYYFLITYWGALRIGEVNALNWADLNFKNHSLTINKSLDRDGVISTPKTWSSYGTIDLPSFLIEKLKIWKKEINPKSDNEFIFFNNHFLARTTIRRMMIKHQKMANLPFIKFHALRHSMASRMINHGCNPLLVAKHLRHASTQQTLDTYSHLFPNVNQGLMDKLV